MVAGAARYAVLQRCSRNALLIAALTGGKSYGEKATMAEPHRDLSLADLMVGLAGNSIDLIDVRESHEYAAGHIPGSRNMPLSTFDPHQLTSEKTVVLSCQAGKRSAIALDRAISAGKNNVRQFPAGFAAWLNAGFSVETE